MVGGDAIICERLTKRYGRVLALDRLDLRVRAGTVFGVLGPNGAGKTTLMRLLTGLARPSAGRALVAGIAVTGGSLQLRQRISTLDQQPQFYGWMRGRELLEFVGTLYGLRGVELRRRVDEILAVVGMTDAAARRIGGYSGGMRQRLGLAQALLARPEVLFLDEPASALDPAGRHDILRMIADLRGRTTIVMSTHILADVERICDAVAILDKGRLIVSSSVVELQERYAQPVFELELDPGQAGVESRLVAALRALPEAGQISAEGEHIRVVARDATATSRAILRLVAEEGVALQRFERARPSLEDIFLRLVTNTDPAGREREEAEVMP
jgi:ABC-2 type transport system ATP-binding protein